MSTRSSSSSSRGNGSTGGRDNGQDNGQNNGSKGKEGSFEQSFDGEPVREKESERGPVDDFGLDNFLVHDEQPTDSVEIVQEKIENTPDSDLSDSLASELVERMVAATKSALQSPMRRNMLTEITPHTISVLRASRIITHTVQASGTDIFKYPIEKRVKAQLRVGQLDLSPPAREALLLLAGPRVKENGTWIKLSCDRFPTKGENRTYVITLLDRLVAAAKSAVGDHVDRTPLSHWNDVVAEVRQQAQEEINEAGSIEKVVGFGN